MSRLAFTRPVSDSIGACALSYLDRTPIDLDAARRQHRHYEEALETLGCTVERLPAADELPDAVFVEDTALVLDEIAVITRPGAASRRAELPTVADRLGKLRPLLWLRLVEVNEAKGKEKMTALHYAALRGHAEVAEVLTAAGAEVDAKVE